MTPAIVSRCRVFKFKPLELEDIKDALIMKKRYNVLYFGGMVMNKTELVAVLAEKAEVSKKDAEKRLSSQMSLNDLIKKFMIIVNCIITF